MKVAIALQRDGNVYDVTYPHTRTSDSNVSYAYLCELTRRGYRVEIGASPYGVACTLLPPLQAESEVAP